MFHCVDWPSRLSPDAALSFVRLYAQLLRSEEITMGRKVNDEINDLMDIFNLFRVTVNFHNFDF